MAKLKARGRQEIFRVVRERETPDDLLTVSEKVQIALMSDGHILKRRIIRWRERDYDGSPTHDYGWKDIGKVRPGLTAEDTLKIYIDKNYTLESSSPEYLIRRGNMISDVSNKPLRTAAEAEREIASKKKREIKAKERPTPRESKRTERKTANNGPGFYVTNGTLYGSPSLSIYNRARTTDEAGPFHSLEEAEEHAWAKFNELRSMSFNYLLPVAVIESTSRKAAESDIGHVWWIDGKPKGPPVDPRQLGFHNGF